MKKNEQLFRAIGKISPTYIEMAADGKVPAKQTRAYAPYGRFRALGVLAAMLVVAVMMFALGMSVSAAEPDPENEEYQIGTMLMDIPEVITCEDYDAMYAKVEAGLATATEIPESTRKHWLLRFDAFWAEQDPAHYSKPHVIEALFAQYPITEVVPVRTIDMFLTECERDFLHHMMVTYGGITQKDLLAYTQNLYDLTASSALSQEQKQTVYASLPALPTISPTAPPANYLTSEAEAAGKHQLTPLMLPYVLLPEDYAIIRDAVLAKYGAESVELLPMQAQKFLSNYTKYPLELSNPDAHHLMTEQHFAELTADMELYILNSTLTIEERVTLCYQFATEADIWGDDAAQMAYSLGEDALKAVYGDDAGSWGPKWYIIITYWKNFVYAFGFANNEW